MSISLRIVVILVLILSLSVPPFEVLASPLHAVSPPLGTLDSYSVLAATTVTCTGVSAITGDVGVSPGTSITGFPAPCVVGPPGSTHSNDASATAAQADNVTVYDGLDQTCDATFGAVDLSTVFPAGVSPGVYCSTSSFHLSANLNLIGTGVWIFKTESTMITSPGASVTGGDACNVWWRVGSSATLDLNTAFIGNIVALESITMNQDTTLNGRALALNGAVTLDTNSVSSVCAQAPTSTPTNTATNTPTNTATNTPTSSQTTTLTNTSTATNTVPPATGTALASAAALTGTTTSFASGILTVTPLGIVPVPISDFPDTGGAAIRSESSPWPLVIFSALSLLGLVAGIRASRQGFLRKRNR